MWYSAVRYFNNGLYECFMGWHLLYFLIENLKFLLEPEFEEERGCFKTYSFSLIILTIVENIFTQIMTILDKLIMHTGCMRRKLSHSFTHLCLI